MGYTLHRIFSCLGGSISQHGLLSSDGFAILHVEGKIAANCSMLHRVTKGGTSTASPYEPLQHASAHFSLCGHLMVRGNALRCLDLFPDDRRFTISQKNLVSGELFRVLAPCRVN
jgi:hypothetical protein